MSLCAVDECIVFTHFHCISLIGFTFNRVNKIIFMGFFVSSCDVKKWKLVTGLTLLEHVSKDS